MGDPYDPEELKKYTDGRNEVTGTTAVAIPETTTLKTTQTVDPKTTQQIDSQLNAYIDKMQFIGATPGTTVALGETIKLNTTKDEVVKAIRNMDPSIFKYLGVSTEELIGFFNQIIDDENALTNIRKGLDVWNSQLEQKTPFGTLKVTPKRLDQIVDKRNKYIANEDFEKARNLDKKYNLDLITTPDGEPIPMTKISSDFLTRLYDLYKDKYFIEENDTEDLFVLLSEMTADMSINELDKGMQPNVLNNLLFAINNTWNKWETFEGSGAALYNPNVLENRNGIDSEKWKIVDRTNNRVKSAPSSMTKEENFNVMLRAGIDAKLIPPVIKDIYDRIDIDGTIKMDGNEASAILRDLGIEPQEGESYFSVGAFTDPVKQIDEVLDNWYINFSGSANDHYKGSTDHGDPKSYYEEKATGDDVSEIFPIVGGTERKDEEELQLFKGYNWDVSSDIETNIKNIMETPFVPGDNGKLYSLNPNDAWPPSIVKAFGPKLVASTARKEQNKVIKKVLDSPIGQQYTQALISGAVTPQLSFQVFKEMINEVGLDGNIFVSNMTEHLIELKEIEWAIDLKDIDKTKIHAKNWFADEGILDALDVDLQQLSQELMSGDFSSYEDARNDKNLTLKTIQKYNKNKASGKFTNDVSTIPGRAAELTNLFNNNFDEFDYAAFQNAPIENQRELQSMLEDYDSQAEALADPRFKSKLISTVREGYLKEKSDQVKVFQSNLSNNIESKFQTKGLFNENTSSEFYNHVTKNVIPNLAFRAGLAGIKSSTELDNFLSEAFSGFDAQGDPSPYQVPEYDFNESAYQSKSNLFDEARKASTGSPEFQAFLMNEMQTGDFMQKALKVTTPQLKEDPQANLTLQQDELNFYEEQLAKAQQKFDDTSETGTGSEIALSELESARQQLSRAQRKFDLQTGKSQYRVIETAPDSGEYKTTGEILRVLSVPEAQKQLQYALETGNEYTQMIAREELAKAQLKAKYFETEKDFSLGEFKNVQDKEDFEKMVTITPKTSSEFFQSQLAGFETKYKQSSFFKQEEERLKRERTSVGDETEAIRRRQLRKKPSGMSVFRRGRR